MGTSSKGGHRREEAYCNDNKEVEVEALIG